MLVSKSNITKDQKWRDSFKKMHTHICWITRQQFTEYSTQGITGAHITIGRHGRNIKDDSLIVPLRQDLHLAFDRNQPQFIAKYWEHFPHDRRDAAIEKLRNDTQERLNGIATIDKAWLSQTEIFKEMARMYYREWLDNQE